MRLAALLCAAWFALIVGGWAAEAAHTTHTPAEVFADMAKAFKKEKAKGLHITYLWRLSNPQGGDWWIKIDDGKCTMGKGLVDKPDCTLICTGDDWVALDNETVSGMRLFLSGRLKVQGDRDLARKLNELFP